MILMANDTGNFKSSTVTMTNNQSDNSPLVLGGVNTNHRELLHPKVRIHLFSYEMFFFCEFKQNTN